METSFGGKLHNFYGPEVGKKKISMEWDLNDWRWDGDLFMATPLNPAPSDCKSRQLFLMNNGVGPASNCFESGSDEATMVRENRDLEKRRRVEETGSLNLKLGGQVYPVVDGEEEDVQGRSGKKIRVASGAVSSRAVCQVDDCKVDLNSAKDYHRRHKVCDVHSKATTALVGNVMQRFCQQCSRFHVLKEFDEGKRSCRRRLAGHNKRRRKTHPENVVNTAIQNDERGFHSFFHHGFAANSSDQSKDQDLLSHLLSNLANLAATTTNERNGAAVSQGLQNVGTAGPVVNIPPTASVSQPASLFPTNSIKEQPSDPTVGKRTKLNNIDLNNVYDGSQDCAEENLGNNMTSSAAGPLWLYPDSQRSSPPQISGNSGSTSTSTSSGEAQSRTDRIVFKLFGKDPSDFPLVLRKQILDWLSSTPTDIESYIRPGCVILTIYLRMDKSNWDELYCDLASSLSRLFNLYTDPFWSTGWIYARVQNRVTFMYNGQVVLDTPLPVKHDRNCRISSIKPIAVTVSENVQFSVKGFNLSRSTLRLLCTLEGKYLVQENCADSFIEHDELQSFSFSCVIPNTVGRGFIEVEDNGFSSSFFPFIVAEKDVCSEICTLESIFDDTNNKLSETRNQALEFIHEMGWLLHRARFKIRFLGETNGVASDLSLFSFQRFRWLAEFSIDHDWCAVVKKLLNILFDDHVETVDSKFVDNISLLLHRAVKRNCSSMVELLLNYRAYRDDYYLFRPDAVGPGELTPLHVAACLDNCNDVVDALTQDPGSVGIKAWKTARDSSGLTPHDYAHMRGHNSYNDLVQKKLDTMKSEDGHVVVDIFEQKTGKSSSKLGALEIGGVECGQCAVKRLSFGKCSSRASVRLYRPAMLSMVAIAAVCVCTALLFKSSPYVHPSLGPFRWELLKYGSQ
ncbi:hypothetical protein CASFOL_030197 [Castilleja foliolosa]|uniref:SBP-type domain-containing protein n=1 Tax=Castilleja foliolosa TaxID=1961234 RepID=A0ABD3CA26_9LAMI